jgi:hypothetical protein
LRQSLLYAFASFRPDYPGEYPRNLYQVLVAEVRAAGSDGYERIRRDRIRPSGRYRAQAALSIMKVHAILAPVVAINDQLKLLSE